MAGRKKKIHPDSWIHHPKKRKRGRPPGSQNKPMFGPIYDPAKAGKRGRGRPRGSKKAVMYGPVYDRSKAGKRGRGRPRGSKKMHKAHVILSPLGGNKHHIRLEGEVTIK